MDASAMLIRRRLEAASTARTLERPPRAARRDVRVWAGMMVAATLAAVGTATAAVAPVGPAVLAGAEAERDAAGEPIAGVPLTLAAAATMPAPDTLPPEPPKARSAVFISP